MIRGSKDQSSGTDCTECNRMQGCEHSRTGMEV